MSAVGLDAVDEVLHDALVHLAAQLEVVHEDVLHGDGLQDLHMTKKHQIYLDEITVYKNTFLVILAPQKRVDLN